jgi:two-component system, OmpR family, sensor histidine kinase SenX3
LRRPAIPVSADAMNVAVVVAAVAAVAGVAVGYVIAVRRADPRPPAGSTPSVEQPDSSVEHLDSSVEQEAALLRDAVEHLDIGMVIASPSGAVRYRNTAATAFVGTHVGVLLEDHMTSILAEASRGERASRIVELHGPPKSWLAIAAEPLPAGGAVATIQDVSERMRTDAMRTDFVTNISHELKTPVGAIAVLAETLMDEPDREVVHRLADHLVEESHRAVRTIDDLLQLSQIESTRPGDTVVDLAAVVSTAISRGRIADAGRGVHIEAIDAAIPILIRGDERQLASAVGNLVENAVKYSHAGGAVAVRTSIDDTSVEVSVADQGVGIPVRDLDRVFERFYRVDKARSRDTGGTGLGLAIVRHVATNHGGDVLVSSQEGEGSTFVFRLPASLVVDPDTAARSRPHAPDSHPLDSRVPAVPTEEPPHE